MEIQYQDKIQNNVDNARNNQEQQRRPAVTQSPDYIGQQIKQGGGKQSRINNNDVCIGILNNIVRRLKDTQKRTRDQDTESHF